MAKTLGAAGQTVEKEHILITVWPDPFLRLITFSIVGSQLFWLISAERMMNDEACLRLISFFWETQPKALSSEINVCLKSPQKYRSFN